MKITKINAAQTRILQNLLTLKIKQANTDNEERILSLRKLNKTLDNKRRIAGLKRVAAELSIAVHDSPHLYFTIATTDIDHRNFDPTDGGVGTSMTPAYEELRSDLMAKYCKIPDYWRSSAVANVAFPMFPPQAQYRWCGDGYRVEGQANIDRFTTLSKKLTSAYMNGDANALLSLIESI
jgi:hypothetical protein